MSTKASRLNWVLLTIYAGLSHAAPDSNNAGGLPQCQADLTTYQTANAQLQNSLSACQTTNTQLQQQIQNDQATISSLQTSLSNAQASNTQLQQQLDAAQSQITALQSALQSGNCSGGGSTTPPMPPSNLPSGMSEYIEFSLLPSSIASDRYQSNKWDLTGNHTNIAVGSSMTWDATLKAWKAPGGVGDYYNCTGADAIDTAWRPSSGPKTACMWKRYYDSPSGYMGLDGYQTSTTTGGNYFFYGTTSAYCPTGSYGWSYGSGANGRISFGCNTALDKNEWIFFCMTSGGNQATSSLYTALPGDPSPVQRYQTNNGQDSGFSSSPTGMRYGCLDANQSGSRAHYGSMIHFNSQLTADQVNQVYQATKVYYPGHGGTR